MYDSPSSILAVKKKEIGTVMQPCKGFPSSLSMVFNKMASVIKSMITFVMLHNTDTKCE